MEQPETEKHLEMEHQEIIVLFNRWIDQPPSIRQGDFPTKLAYRGAASAIAHDAQRARAELLKFSQLPFNSILLERALAAENEGRLRLVALADERLDLAYKVKKEWAREYRRAAYTVLHHYNRALHRR